ncbi:MAG: nitroreductase family protein [Planctomycetota bacterium]
MKRAVTRALARSPIKATVWRLCVRYPFLADQYYAFTGGFRREHRAVLLGKLKHVADMQDSTGKGGEYTLRRNIHRLEKGIISRPRRPVFARDYIGETVRVYTTLAAEKDAAIQPLLNWAHDVLSEYFELVSEDPAIEPHRQRFASSQNGFCSGTKLMPYQREQTPLRVDLEGLSELAWRRRSVRWFVDKPVPRDVIDRAVEVAKLSPSACNRQPFEFRVYDDPELSKKVGAVPMGTRGFAQNFPCVIVIVGDLRAYFSERDRHVIYVDAGLAAMALQFALEVQGVSTCCINWPDVEANERAMDSLIGLKPNQRPVMCMAVGYADPEGSVPYSQKKGLDEIRSYNRTG